jgi:hypothetical protein
MTPVKQRPVGRGEVMPPPPTTQINAYASHREHT